MGVSTNFYSCCPFDGTANIFPSASPLIVALDIGHIWTGTVVTGLVIYPATTGGRVLSLEYLFPMSFFFFFLIIPP